MAEKIVSPGVFTNEVDQSFLPAGVQAIGAALIGPTAKGQAGIPTIVSSYSEFVQKFGGKFSSGSGAFENSYKYLTNYAAQEYLKYADTLTVVRVAPGATPATATIQAGSTVGDTFSSGSLRINNNIEGETYKITQGSTTVRFIAQSFPNSDDSDNDIRFFSRGTTNAQLASSLVNEIDAVIANGTLSGIDASLSGSDTVVISGSAKGTTPNGITFVTASGGSPTSFGAASGESGFTMAGGTNVTTAVDVFTLTTLSDGADQNSFTAVEGTNNTLASGSENNIRFDITTRNLNKGTFNL